MLNSRFIEMRMFKAVAGGYIFQLPPPTIFTPTEAVIVTPEQRDQILAMTRKRSPRARRLVFWAAVIVGILSGRLGGQIEDMPLAVAVFLGFAACFITLIAGTVGFTLHMRAILSPMLEPLPRSKEMLFPVGPKASWTDFQWMNRQTAQG